MVLSSIAASLLISTTPVAPVELRRLFTKGEKAQYKIHSSMNAEVRQGDLETWIPQDLDLIYKFNYEVKEMKADGICVMRYLRPILTEIQGETYDSPPKTKNEKQNLDFELTVSPVNEVLELKDLAKKPEKPPKKKPPALNFIAERGNPQLQAFVGQFIGEIHRLALYIGALDSSLDFSPPLPLLEVSPGDSWKKTVGFSPQKLKDKGDKFAVQRLDFTYIYKGIIESNGIKVHRIEGSLSLSSDLAAFIHQTFNVKSNVTGLKEIPMQMSSKIEFDLDVKTCVTLRARATTTGGFRVLPISTPDKAIEEEKFNSRSSLDLLSLKR